MKFNLFNYLNLASDKNFEDTPEKRSFDAFSNLLAVSDLTRRFMNADSGFALIQANVIITALLSKQIIESYAPLYATVDHLSPVDRETVHDGLPFFLYKGKRIYVPIFAPGINTRYDTGIKTLAKAPFNKLKTTAGIEALYKNPFYTYGLAVYDSPFTRLLKIMQRGTEAVYYSYSFDTIYHLSAQGTLECAIPIFDRALEKPDRENLPVRIEKLMTSYFDFNRTLFIDELLNLGFISEALYGRINNLSKNQETRRAAKTARAKMPKP